MEKLQLQLKHYQDALEKSNQQAMVEKMEKTTMEQDYLNNKTLRTDLL